MNHSFECHFCSTLAIYVLTFPLPPAVSELFCAEGMSYISATYEAAYEPISVPDTSNVKPNTISSHIQRLCNTVISLSYFKYLRNRFPLKTAKYSDVH